MKKKCLEKSLEEKKKKINRVLFKIRMKNTILDILYLLIVFLFALIFDKWFEMLIFVISYTLIRTEFLKAIHGSDFTESAKKGIIYCRIITFIVEIISVLFICNLNISKYINIILAVVLGIINFFAKDYLEYKIKKMVFYKGMKEIPKELKGIEYEIMYQYYIKRYKLDKIAMNLGYSVDNIKKIKAKILKRYS